MPKTIENRIVKEKITYNNCMLAGNIKKNNFQIILQKIFAILLVFFFIFTIILSISKVYLNITHPIKYVEIIKNNSDSDLPEEFIASVINVESSFNANAKSKKSAIGLMQIKVETANYMADILGLENVTENELYSPEINIKYGCLYLKYLMKKFGNKTAVLCAYNAGETVVRSWLKNPEYTQNQKIINIPYAETRNYVKKVNDNIKYYKKYL